tara:strand:+ start:5122 stop:5532 length:411 start_codon:yes stop_codon:yes gene_type:complete
MIIVLKNQFYLIKKKNIIFINKKLNMEKILIFSQIVIAFSILIVWVFRYENIVVEFEHYQLSTLTRNLVGALKISLSTILVLGIWYNELLFFSSLMMAFLMICAQYFHFKFKNPIHKFIPSFLLLLISLFIATISY